MSQDACLHEDAFGDLQFQQARLQASLCQDRRDAIRQLWIGALTRREIDRHAQAWHALLLPGPRLLAGRAERPIADGENHPGVFGDWDEIQRRDLAQLWVGPAHQCFDAGDTAAVQCDLGLVGEGQFLILQRLAQLVFHGQLSHRLDMHPVPI